MFSNISNSSYASDAGTSRSSREPFERATRKSNSNTSNEMGAQISEKWLLTMSPQLRSRSGASRSVVTHETGTTRISGWRQSDGGKSSTVSASTTGTPRLRTASSCKPNFNTALLYQNPKATTRIDPVMVEVAGQLRDTPRTRCMRQFGNAPYKEGFVEEVAFGRNKPFDEHSVAMFQGLAGRGAWELPNFPCEAHPELITTNRDGKVFVTSPAPLGSKKQEGVRTYTSAPSMQSDVKDVVFGGRWDLDRDSKWDLDLAYMYEGSAGRRCKIPYPKDPQQGIRTYYTNGGPMYDAEAAHAEWDKVLRKGRSPRVQRNTHFRRALAKKDSSDAGTSVSDCPRIISQITG